jgi:hypothetical protein
LRFFDCSLETPIHGISVSCGNTGIVFFANVTLTLVIYDVLCRHTA